MTTDVVSLTTPPDSGFELREADFTLIRADEDDDGLTLEGYAAVFGSPTRIDSWEGNFDEVIAPGAFKRTIGQKGPGGVRLQFDHGHHPLIGSIPIGSIRELREDARGLYVKARMADNWLIQPVRDAIANGSVSGMSFRFRVIRDDWDKTGDVPLRTLQEIDLAEVGPVVWPAYEATTVGVRARQIAADLANDSDFRDQLVRALAAAGTSTEPAVDGTSVEPATDDGPPEGTRRSQAERRQQYRRLFGATPSHDIQEDAA